MCTKLIQILLLILVASVLVEGLPELSAAVHNVMPNDEHSPQYNLLFWILILITIFSVFKNPNWNKPQ